MPPTLTDATATEPAWLQSWVILLGVGPLGALLFVAHRRDGRWAVRPEPFAILGSFFAAAALMDWLYGQVGYVRLLGLAHLVFWTPAWVWVLSRRAEIGAAGAFGKYLHFYLAIAGASLAIDAIDVVRHLLGDGALLNRWS